MIAPMTDKPMTDKPMTDRPLAGRRPRARRESACGDRAGLRRLRMAESYGHAAGRDEDPAHLRDDALGNMASLSGS
jgi:hypothetical protein